MKISGCPNSCGQHHIAPIGLFGGSKSFDGRQVPTYQMMLGGAEPFARSFLKIPASKVPGAVAHLAALYEGRREPDEDFPAFLDRYGRDRLKSEMAPFTELPPYEESPESYGDVAS